MAGFTAIVSKHKIPQTLSFRNKNISDGFVSFNHKLISGKHYLFELYTNSKFAAEKICQEDEQFVVITEGVLLNLQTLQQKHQSETVFELIKTLYTINGRNFVKELRGDFSGLLYDKSTNDCFVFTNHTGSKRVFYLYHPEYFICSSDLKEISHMMNQLNLPKKLNVQAAYFMLTCGFMLEENTLIEEVKRLMPGNYLLYNGKEMQLTEYFHLKNIEKTSDNKTQIINRIDELFAHAVNLQFEKDKAYGYKHAATLSGGLDSRMTVLVAHKLGYTDQLNFTFSQANYLDEKIARKIALDYKHEFIFKSLGNGDYLKEIDQAVLLNDGLVVYSGAAHVLDPINQIDFSSYGILHTGLIGDAVIGSFLSAPHKVIPHIADGMYSTVLINIVKNDITKILQLYPNEELYKFYSRAFLGATNGNYFFDKVSHAISPFLDVDFLSYCYSIPDEMKYKQKIYIDWIKVKHPEFGRYPWEKTGISPLKTHIIQKFTDIKYYQRMSLKLFDRLSGQMKSGMNPFDHWLSHNKTLSAFLEQYFHDHIVLLNATHQLKADCINLYQTGNSGEKFQVLTLLSAIKLHQIQA